MDERESKGIVQAVGPLDEFDVLVATASWEDRFTLGLQRILERHSVKSVVLFQYEEWADRTESAMEEAIGLCRDRDIARCRVSLSHKWPEKTRGDLRTALDAVSQPSARALVDISTMPREAIWTTFFFLEALGIRVAYAYHEPESYDGAWLSRDPSRPRFVPQMSGEATLGRDTVLLVTTGFDPSRTVQLMRTFEPKLTLMALQEGEQFRNMTLNVEPHEGLVADQGPKFQEHYPCQCFLVDAYCPDHGRAAIESKLKDHLDAANVIMSSLGPKLTSVALYQIHRRYPATALVYAPSGEYNPDYSKGIGNTVLQML